MSAASDLPYPAVNRPDFPAIETKILARWAEDDTFQESIDQRPDDSEYVFYDGPPFANGLPHHGHLLTGYVKDVIPRYQTMRGNKVERRFGWDCHGLPAEMETEKQLDSYFQVLDKTVDTIQNWEMRKAEIKREMDDLNATALYCSLS